MTDRTQIDQEALSALMDGELSDFELRRLLSSVADQPELLQTWERYNLVRAAFQPEPLSLDILKSRAAQDQTGLSALGQRIMATIEAEAPLQSGNLHGLMDGASDTDSGAAKVTATGWSGNLVRLAVAASVALAVFVGMQSLLDTPDMPSVASQQDATDNQRLSDQSQIDQSRNSIQLAVDAEAQQRLNDYIRSVSIPSHPESTGAPYNVLLESPMLHPVSDRELIQQVERVTTP